MSEKFIDRMLVAIILAIAIPFAGILWGLFLGFLHKMFSCG